MPVSWSWVLLLLKTTCRESCRCCHPHLVSFPPALQWTCEPFSCNGMFFCTQQADTSGDGTINYDEFVQLYSKYEVKHHSDQELREIEEKWQLPEQKVRDNREPFNDPMCKPGQMVSFNFQLLWTTSCNKYHALLSGSVNPETKKIRWKYAEHMRIVLATKGFWDQDCSQDLSTTSLGDGLWSSKIRERHFWMWEDMGSTNWHTWSSGNLKLLRGKRCRKRKRNSWRKTLGNQSRLKMTHRYSTPLPVTCSKGFPDGSAGKLGTVRENMIKAQEQLPVRY